MKSRIAAIVALSLLFAGAAAAADHGQTVGAGADLCAEFNKAYAADPKGAEDMHWSWAMGMMSGMNFATVANSNVYRDLIADPDIMRRAIRAFCVAHPLTTYSGAVLDLYVGLPLRKSGAK